jgi:hypothetical protein
MCPYLTENSECSIVLDILKDIPYTSPIYIYDYCERCCVSDKPKQLNKPIILMILRNLLEQKNIYISKVAKEYHEIIFSSKKDEIFDNGVGTELHKLLKLIGYKITPGCKCLQYIREMNKNGIEWCEQNKSTIIDWLKEEHKRRKLVIPFSPFAASKLIELAIWRAKRKRGI